VKRMLLIVDMLNDFIDPKGVLFCGKSSREIIPVIKDLVEECKSKGDSVIYLADAHEKDDREFDRFPPHAVKGTWGAQVVPELAPDEEDLVIEKKRFSGFYGTELDGVLKDLAPDEVWVVGVCTSICVMDTVGDLCNRDIPVVVVENGVADFDEEFHRFALARMERVYGAKIIKW